MNRRFGGGRSCKDQGFALKRRTEKYDEQKVLESVFGVGVWQNE